MFEVKCATINTKSKVQKHHHEISKEAITNPSPVLLKQVLVAEHMYSSGQHHVVPLQQW